MIAKFVVGTLLNLLAAVAPTALAYFTFGPSTKVNAQDPKQALYIGAFVVMAFVLSSLAGIVSRRSQPSGLEDVAAGLMKSASSR
jgi:hypothetical protein